MFWAKNSAPRSSNDDLPAPSTGYHWRRWRRKITPYLFLSPFLIGYIAFMVYPLIYSFNLSLYRKQIIGGVTFVGLANYVNVFRDTNFWEGIRNVLIFGAMQIPVMLGLALIFGTDRISRRVSGEGVW